MMMTIWCFATFFYAVVAYNITTRCWILLCTLVECYTAAKNDGVRRVTRPELQ